MTSSGRDRKQKGDRGMNCREAEDFYCANAIQSVVGLLSQEQASACGSCRDTGVYGTFLPRAIVSTGAGDRHMT